MSINRKIYWTIYIVWITNWSAKTKRVIRRSSKLNANQTRISLQFAFVLSCVMFNRRSFTFLLLHSTYDVLHLLYVDDDAASYRECQAILNQDYSLKQFWRIGLKRGIYLPICRIHINQTMFLRIIWDRLKTATGFN